MNFDWASIPQLIVLLEIIGTSSAAPLEKWLFDLYVPTMTIDLLNLITALGASGLGAFGGAVGASFIARRGERRNRLVEELRATNAATIVANNLTRVGITLKDQHTKGLIENYARDKKRAIEFVASNSGVVPEDPDFAYEADLQQLEPIEFPIDLLERLLFERAPMLGRPQTALTSLTLSVESLHQSLRARNTLIEGFKSRNLSAKERFVGYFGIEQEDDHDTSYPDTIDAIGSNIDAVIFFGLLIANDMADHAKRLKPMFRPNKARIVTPQFDQTAMSLVPPDSEFPGWSTLPKEPLDSVITGKSDSRNRFE